MKKSNSTIITAVCTAAGLIALAFYQRYEGPIPVSPEAFFAAGGIICVGAVFYARFRGNPCRNKSPRVG